MKSLSLLALIGLTTLFIGCSSTDKKTSDSGNDLPVPANTTTTTTTTTMAPQNAEPMTTVVTPTPAGTAVTQTSGVSTTTTVATVDYTVVSGDSLWKIARDHRTSVAKLKALNGMANDKLMPGQVIKVPAAQ